MVYTLISCEQRREYRERTLEQLASVGIAPQLFISPCQPPSQSEQRRNSRLALAHAGDDDMVFFEDDILVNDRLPKFIELAVRSQEIVHFYLAGTRFLSKPNQQLVAQGRPMRPGLYPIQHARGHFGTQATYLPPGLAKQLLDTPYWQVSMPFDIALRTYARKAERRMLAALPNPVQHQGPPNLVAPTARKPHKSLTFELGGAHGADGRHEHLHQPR